VLTTAISARLITHYNNFTVVLYLFVFQNLMKQCVTLVKAISGNDDVKVAVVKSGIVDDILNVLSKHRDNPQVRQLLG